MREKLTMKKPVLIKGRAWVLRDEKGRAIDDIDTDQIYHNAHLAITDIKKMGQFALGNLPGWEDFPQKAQPGDILVVGRNFGAGSSRQQAVDCFRSLGIALIIGGSFGAIYKRNAINSGFPLLICPEIASHTGKVDSGNILQVNLSTGEIDNNTTGHKIKGAQPLSTVQMEIYQAGNLFEYGKSALS